MNNLYTPYDDDRPLAGPDLPPIKSIIDLIRYCTTVHKRFGDTCITVSLQWGACALNNMDKLKKELTNVNWSTEQPTEPGYYWYRDKMNDGTIVEVDFNLEDKLVMTFFSALEGTALHLWGGEWSLIPSPFKGV